MNKKNLAVAMMMIALLLYGLIPVQAISATSTTILLYAGKATAFVNNEEVQLAAPIAVIAGKTYIDPQFFADRFQVSAKSDAKANRMELKVADNEIVLNLKAKLARINGVLVPLKDLAVNSGNGVILIKFSWLMNMLKLNYTYDAVLKRITITYITKPDGLIDQSTGNSKPVAKFAFGKNAYRIGEPIKIIDLSYDVDGDAIVSRKWTGKPTVFFQAGTYPVSLQVQDKQGAFSDVYARSVTVTDEPYLTEAEYPFYMQALESVIGVDSDTLKHFKNVPSLPAAASVDNTRSLLVSDSPETITQTGILYQDTVNGKARLYAHHMNGMDEHIQFAIVATNESERDITIKTTNKGEVYPSIYAHLLGHQASLDFQLRDKPEQQMVVPAGETQIVSLMPDFAPGYGINAIYDVETDGPVMFAFAAMNLTDSVATVPDYPLLAYDRNIRGTFGVTQLFWDVDMSGMSEPSKVVIGDNVSDRFIAGFDAVSQTERVDFGNYGVIYNIHADKPPKMAILLIARGGLYKGPININGQMVMVPKSGVLSPYDGLYLLARTDGTEKSLDIEFTPSAGSALPVNLLFYPLGDLE